MNLNLSNLADMTKVKPILYALGAILLMVFAYWISTQWTGNVSTHFADQVLKEKEAMVDKNYSNTVSEKEREIAALKQKVSQAGNRIQTGRSEDHGSSGGKERRQGAAEPCRIEGGV